MAKTNAERQAEYRARKKAAGLRRNWIETETPRTSIATALENLNKVILEKSKDYWTDELQAFFAFLFDQVARYKP
jgi:hypothetical protein